MVVKLSLYCFFAWLPVAILLMPAVPEYTALQLIAWGIGVSVLGGIAAAMRTEHHWWAFIKVAFNTGVIGGSICAFSLKWTLADPFLGWMLLAVVCVLSAAGLVFVEWFVSEIPQFFKHYVQEWLARWFGDVANDDDNDEKV
jgi:hypothetical protein